MNILLFIPDKDPAVGGIFQYINCLLAMAGKEDKQNTYYLFLRNNSALFIKYSKQYANIKCIPESESGNRSVLYSFKEKMIKGILLFFKKIKINIDIQTPSSLDKIIDTYKIDIIHFPYQRFEQTKIPSITTIHDVQELYFPQYFSSEERASRAVNNKKCIDSASKVVCSYEHIKKDIITYFDKPEEDVEAILLNMQNLWFEKFQTESNQVSTVNPTTVLPFLLCPAVTWEHKNHLNLLKAIVYLREHKKCAVTLVCTGKKTDYYDAVLEPYIKENNLQNQVSFKGVVSDEELYQLYQTCTGVVVPTKYEAGSFPLMESILMEVPVVCSNVTSLPETIGNAAYTFDPYTIESIAEKVELLFSSASFREACIKDIALQANRLQHTNAFEQLIKIYNQLHKDSKKG